MKVECIRDVSFGATGESFESGKTYTVPAKLANDYPGHFKKLSTTKNKKQETEENK